MHHTRFIPDTIWQSATCASFIGKPWLHHRIKTYSTWTKPANTSNHRKKKQYLQKGKCRETNLAYQKILAKETTTDSHIRLATNFGNAAKNHETKQNFHKHKFSLMEANKPYQIKWKYLVNEKHTKKISQETSWKLLTICRKNLCNEVHTTQYKKQERERAENSYFS